MTPKPSIPPDIEDYRDARWWREPTRPEASLASNLKDDLLARGRATFIAPRLLAYFHAIWGIRRADEARRGPPRTCARNPA
jgi:hypothetical protein